MGIAISRIFSMRDTVTSTTITRKISNRFIAGCFKRLIKRGVGYLDCGLDSFNIFSLQLQVCT